ncbi:hypothetical protein Tco_1220712 [Tanacetum coccineum]
MVSRCSSSVMRESVIGESDVDERRDIAGIDIGQDPKNYSKENFDSSVDTQKSHDDPRSLHNKDIAVENLVKFVENYQGFD